MQELSAERGRLFMACCQPLIRLAALCKLLSPPHDELCQVWATDKHKHVS